MTIQITDNEFWTGDIDNPVELPRTDFAVKYDTRHDKKEYNQWAIAAHPAVEEFSKSRHCGGGKWMPNIVYLRDGYMFKDRYENTHDRVLGCNKFAIGSPSELLTMVKSKIVKEQCQCRECLGNA